jgi:hypothetical protein
MVSIGSQYHHDHPTGDARALASCRFPPVLALEVPLVSFGERGVLVKLPTTAATPMASCATPIRQEGAQRLIFDQPLRFAPRIPCDQIQASSGLSESCQKTQTYRTLRFLAVAALVPSAGT